MSIIPFPLQPKIAKAQEAGLPPAVYDHLNELQGERERNEAAKLLAIKNRAEALKDSIAQIAPCFVDKTHDLIFFVVQEARDMCLTRQAICTAEPRVLVQDLTNRYHVNAMRPEERRVKYRYIACHVFVVSTAIFKADIEMIQNLAKVNRIKVINVSNRKLPKLD